VIAAAVIAVALAWKLPVLAALGIGSLLLVVVAGLASLLPFRLAVSGLGLSTDRTTVGDSGSATIVLVNRGSRRSARASLHLDALDERIPLVVPRISGGSELTISVSLPTGRRGAGAVGPVVAAYADPFGLIRRGIVMSGSEPFIVHPRHHHVHVHAASTLRSAEGRAGTVPSPDALSFVGLRQYRPGDEQRQIHWPTTARTGELMVREYADAPLERLIIAFDTRASRWDEVRFEQGIEIVASLTVSAISASTPVSLITGTDRVDLSGRGVLDTRDVLDHLAALAVQPDRGTRDGSALTTMLARGSSASCIIVTGLQDASDQLLLAEVSRRSPEVVLIEVASPYAQRLPPATASIRVVRAPTAAEFVETWNGAA
jgi:uncharacterized protein (DUF58 family)